MLGFPASNAPADEVARIVYASRSNVQASVYAEMERIRASALRHNGPLGVATALLHQSGWFVQWKEGPGEVLRRLMARVATDPRHHHLRIVHASRGPRLLSGPWSMAIVQCADSAEAFARRVDRVHAAATVGRPDSPPAVWRRLSTPLDHPGAERQDEPRAFVRVLACSARGDGAFDLVRRLARRHRQPVVRRRFAGPRDLDVGTDYVDLDDDGRLLRVIAMARRGLALPLTQAFLPDYSHLALLLSGDPGADLLLVRRMALACGGASPAPVLVGVGLPARQQVALAAVARGHGLCWQAVEAGDGGLAAWDALRPLLAG
ncbi:MAG: BLUF domain-containing protein [Comamonadaceae bacterium]|nr:MAG: BLUF domain-containing protein [Comamonadaceae bacterium]